MILSPQMLHHLRKLTSFLEIWSILQEKPILRYLLSLLASVMSAIDLPDAFNELIEILNEFVFPVQNI